jgi:hypothetical protein
MALRSRSEPIASVEVGGVGIFLFLPNNRLKKHPVFKVLLPAISILPNAA